MEVDNKYLMSPKDLKTVRFIDRMMNAGVRVFKIEGRARGPEYVYTVVRTYKEAIKSVLDGTFTDEKKDAWDTELAKVFNRGFWDGYYQGQRLGEWNKNYGSNATEKKVLVGKVVKFFSRLSVAEIAVEASEIDVNEHLLITGPTTGVMYLDAKEIRYDLKPVERAEKGWRVSIPVEGKVRPNDKVFKIIENHDN
jgi:putative protease